MVTSFCPVGTFVVLVSELRDGDDTLGVQVLSAVAEHWW